MSRLLLDAPFYPTATLRQMAFDRPNAGTFLAGVEVEKEVLEGIFAEVAVAEESVAPVMPGRWSMIPAMTNQRGLAQAAVVAPLPTLRLTTAPTGIEWGPDVDGLALVRAGFDEEFSAGTRVSLAKDGAGNIWARIVVPGSAPAFVNITKHAGIAKADQALAIYRSVLASVGAAASSAPPPEPSHGGMSATTGVLIGVGVGLAVWFGVRAFTRG